MSVHRLTGLALLTAQSLALFVLESLLPLPVPVPGAKLGLANIITLVALYILPRPRDALLILLLRTLLAAVFFGGPSMYIYSAGGALVSFAVMAALKKSGVFSVVGVSAAGGFCHNLAQLFLAVCVAGSSALWHYLPVLGSVGVLSGALLGVAASRIIKRLSAERYVNFC